MCRFIWDDGTGYVSDAMNCLKLCKQEGALITSNSWGGIGYSSEWGTRAGRPSRPWRAAEAIRDRHGV